MDSEKIKEIKKALNTWKIVFHGITNADILTYINEMESENKELKKYRCDWLNSEKMHLQAELEDTEFELASSNRILGEVNKENKTLKDRIAKLEKENKDYYDRLNNAQTYIDNHEEVWKGNTKIQLKQFAERLKEQMNEGEYMGKKYKLSVFRDIDIDETLKEFLL